MEAPVQRRQRRRLAAVELAIRAQAVLLLTVLAACTPGGDPAEEPTYDSALTPYVAFLSQPHAAPVDYILGLFDDHDLVIVCERDQVMARQVSDGFRALELSDDPRKKALVVMNEVVECVTDAGAVAAPAQEGRWDAAFAVVGEPETAFDLAGSPFGDDDFDYHFRYSGITYADVFDGFIFYKPLREHRHHYTVPGIFDDAFLAEYPRRLAAAGRGVRTAEEMREYAAELEARRAVPYNDMEGLQAPIDDWLEPTGQTGE
jgi:hypothetical protein